MYLGFLYKDHLSLGQPEYFPIKMSPLTRDSKNFEAERIQYPRLLVRWSVLCLQKKCLCEER